MNNPKSKVITGPLHADNRGSSDWGPQGFIAYGCHRYVVVVDPKTLQVVQTLGPHTSTITHVKWSREKYHHAFATGRTYSLILAAADRAGNILIWDVVTGNVRTEFQRPHVHIRFLEMEWYPGHDESHDLLVVLRYPGQLEMWDAYSGVQLWKKDFGENMLSFALDPFDINNLIGLCEVTHLVMVSDLNTTKEPQSDRLKYLWYSDPNPVVNNQGSLKRQNSGEKSPSRTNSASSWSKMANLATSMILPESRSKRWSINEEQDNLSSCLQVVYSPVHNHTVLLVFSSEIQFIDVDVELLIGTVRIDKSSPFISKVIPCRTADMLYCLNDNGSVSVRIRKQKGTTEEALDMNYETCCLSDSLRLLRHVKVVGFLHQPMREKQVLIQLSDSKIIILDVMAVSFNKDDPTIGTNITLGDMVNGLSVVLPGKLTDKHVIYDGQGEITLRMVVSGLISGLNFPITCICMRPSRASRHEVGQHLAVGSGDGAIQLVNVYTGQVEHEYKLFSNPVRGMEWMKSSEIIAFTYSEPTNYGNRGVRNEVIVLNTVTGKVTVIRKPVDNEGPILIMKSSPSCKFMVLAVKDKPVEIWNIRTKMLIKSLTELQHRPNYIVIPCRTADMLYCLNDNGSVSVRIRKQKGTTEEALDMNYETCCLSDSLRLLRHVKVVGFLHQPMREKQVLIQLSDSKIIILDVMAVSFNKDDPTIGTNITLGDMVNGLSVVLPGKLTDKHVIYDGQGEITLRMVVSGLISGLNFPITCICMRPSRASRHEVGQHLAVGSGDGAIQLVNVYTGQVEHEYKLFSNPVRGMEWMKSSEIIAFTYSEPTNYGNRGVRNEVIVLNTVTGKVTVIRKPVDNEGPILIMKSSPSCKFMVLAVKDKPVEIWNIRTKMLIKSLTELQHRPNYITWHTSIVTVINEDKKTSIVEQCFITISHDECSLLRFQVSEGIAKKMVFFTNEDIFGQNSARPDTVTMVWKDKKFIMADKAGQLFLKLSHSSTPHARKFHDKTGQVARSVQFAPGKSNYKFLVLYQQSFDVWEIVDKKVEYVASSPSLNSLFLHAAWTGPESVAIITEDFCLHVMNLSGKSPVSPDKHDDFVHVHERIIKTTSTQMQNWTITDVFSPGMLERKTSFLLKYSLQCNIEPFNEEIHSLLLLVASDIRIVIDDASSTAERCLHIARLFGDEHDVEFWELFRYMSKFGHVDETALGSLEKPFSLTEWISKLLSPSTEVNDLLDLSTSDLNPNAPSNDLGEQSLDSSWVNAFVKERELFISSPLGLRMDHDEYKIYEASRLLLHNKRADSYRVKKICASRFIMLNKVVMATQTLMETDTDNPDFRHDCLKACLTSCVQPDSESMGTLKLAATHLIAAGHLQDGVDLMCLMNKQSDACKYMITYGKWLQAVWLAKTGLEGSERLGVLCKYADFLWQNSQKMEAVLVMMSLGQYMTVLRMLLDLGQYDTAALFLQACTENGLLSNLNGTNAVYLEFSKFLIVTQYQSAIEYYCGKAGEQGSSLFQELVSLKK